MKRSTRGLIVLAFALATFATLRFTLGPRWGMHGGPCHHACATHTTTATPAD
ncbi:MAG TPA: hypothetical protein VHL57_06385 [Flavobacteriales bacterium]|jgi:hypothetical protein|nr:hypothetical protein [Flavobacteriales bacterium]